MIDVFMEQKVVTACMFACFFLSIFLKIFLGMLYRHMIKEADNMAITNNKLLKQCKMKFSNCYELNNGIHNIPVFVDKFINKLALGRLSFDLIYHLSGQMMLLTVVAAGIGVSRSILAGHTLGEVVPYYIASFLGLYLYFSISTVTDIKGKRRMLKINLVDYLENHLSSRMSVTRRDLEMLYGEALFQEQMDNEEGADGGKGSLCGLRRERGFRDGKGFRDEKRGHGEKQKRVVELMPMGGRLMAGKADGEDAPQEADAVGMTAQQALGDAAVTEEELEMLLKEFLTG